MKKIFTLMWAIVCAALTVVSCTTDGPNDDPQGPTITSTITVTGIPENNLKPEAGELSLGYTIENPTLTDALVVTTEAAWVHVGEIGEATVAITYDANTDAPGSPAREAVITLAYNGAEDVLVTLKQDSAEAIFSVEFAEVTMNSALAMLKSTDPEIDWLAMCYSSSQIAEVGTPMEFITAQYEMAKAEGMPYLLMFSQIGMQVSGSMGKGDSVDPIYCQLPWSAAPGDKLYMFVLGYNVDADMNNWEYDNSTLNGPIHVFEVPLLAAPVVTLPALEYNVTAIEGEVVVDVTVENPIEGAEIYVSAEAAWVTPSYADGKLTLAYTANTSALSRNTTIAVEYGKKEFYGDGPEDYYIDVLTSKEIALSQEADPNVEAITFEIEVVEEHAYTHFDRIVVNVKPSNKEVEYVLNTVSALDWRGDVVEIDWNKQVSNDVRYLNEDKVFKGDLTNHSIILSPANYDSETPQYHVYAFALSEDKSAVASEASHVLVNVDLSDKPVLTWEVEKSGLTWNSQADRYDLTVAPNSTVTLYYNIANPIEGASLQINDLGNSYGVIEGEPVIDEAAKTITIKIGAFNGAVNYHYARPGFNYQITGDEMWGCSTPSLNLVQTAPSGVAYPFEESFADGIGDFTTYESYLPEGISYVWKHDSYKYMKASAYVSGVGYDVTSYLVSPIISLANATAPVLSFTHCVNYCPENYLTKTCQVLVKEASASSWNTLTIPVHGTGNNWTWNESGDIDLSAYVGKDIVIAFMYNSETNWDEYDYETGKAPVIAPTWEVKNVKVAEK